MPNKGTIVLGTVKGDLHDIGKNLVGMMLESGGFKVHNMGLTLLRKNLWKLSKNIIANRLPCQLC